VKTIVECRNVSKYYGDLLAINNLNLEILDREFIALLGPSGCGKSTTLRIIAGFEQITSGSVSLNGREICSSHFFMPPEKRKIGMVFQDFALFPHLTIGENIAFGLSGSRREKKKRVREMLELVDLESYEKQMPHMISGGQQQRVAVARALAPRPRLILLDEPFSSLDTQLRIQLRNDIRRILKKEGVTVILVTHDQYEAFSFSDRIVMMHEGQVVQKGTPMEIYHKPINSWVARFVGGANFIPANLKNRWINCPLGQFEEKNGTPAGNGHLMIRPEDLQVFPASGADFHGTVQACTFLGSREILKISLTDGQEINAQISSRQNWDKGSQVRLSVEHFRFFPEESPTKLSL